MLINMDPLLSGEKREIAFEFDYTPDSESEFFVSFPDIVFEKPLKVKGAVKNMAGFMLISIAAEIEYFSPCARCLCDVRRNMSLCFDKKIADEHDKSVTSDNDDYLIIIDRQIDPAQPLIEQMMLEFPSKVLCKEDCAGLCPKCGKNLNEGECSCQSEKPISKFSVLKNLFD